MNFSINDSQTVFKEQTIDCCKLNNFSELLVWFVMIVIFLKDTEPQIQYHLASLNWIFDNIHHAQRDWLVGCVAISITNVSNWYEVLVLCSSYYEKENTRFFLSLPSICIVSIFFYLERIFRFPGAGRLLVVLNNVLVQ